MVCLRNICINTLHKGNSGDDDDDDDNNNNNNGMGGVYRVWGAGEAYTRFWWGNLRERDHWGDPGVDGRIILRRIFREWDVGVWT
jgi:hypothetical protein